MLPIEVYSNILNYLDFRQIHSWNLSSKFFYNLFLAHYKLREIPIYTGSYDIRDHRKERKAFLTVLAKMYLLDNRLMVSREKTYTSIDELKQFDPFSIDEITETHIDRILNDCVIYNRINFIKLSGLKVKKLYLDHGARIVLLRKLMSKGLIDDGLAYRIGLYKDIDMLEMSYNQARFDPSILRDVRNKSVFKSFQRAHPEINNPEIYDRIISYAILHRQKVLFDLVYHSQHFKLMNIDDILYSFSVYHSYWYYALSKMLALDHPYGDRTLRALWNMASRSLDLYELLSNSETKLLNRMLRDKRFGPFISEGDINLITKNGIIINRKRREPRKCEKKSKYLKPIIDT